MEPIAPQTVLNALHWRYATKQFDPARKIPDDVWTALEESLRLAPSSFGLEPWKFVLVRDPAVRARLREASWGQPQVTDASHFVVLAGAESAPPAMIDDLAARITATRGTPPEKLAGMLQMISGFVGALPAAQQHQWNLRQVYLAFGQFLAVAALLGVDATPMEGLDPAKYDEILGLPAHGYRTVAAIAAGYRAADDKYAAYAKVRRARADVFLEV